MNLNLGDKISGGIPNGWLVCRWSRVIEAIKDGTHGTFARTTEGMPLLSAKNVQNGSLEIGDVESLISFQDYEQIVANGFPKKGDLLLTIVGSIGRACVYTEDIPHAFQRSVCFIRLAENNSPRFFYYQTQAKFFQEQLVNRSKSAAQAGVYMGDVAACDVLVPSLPEQTAIAAFLDRETGKIDALVEEQKRLIELLKEKRQAVISHAVTKGLNLGAPMKDTDIEWLGDVPEHWEVIRIGNLFREVSEQGSDELPILSVSIHDGVSDKELDPDELDRKVTRSEDRSKYKSVQPGDLVYNMMRAWQGGFGTVRTDGMVSPAYVVARPSIDLETGFIENLLRTPNAVEEMRGRSRGVTDFRLRLYWDEFKNIRLALPLWLNRNRSSSEYPL